MAFEDLDRASAIPGQRHQMPGGADHRLDAEPDQRVVVDHQAIQGARADDTFGLAFHRIQQITVAPAMPGPYRTFVYLMLLVNRRFARGATYQDGHAS